MEFVFGNEERFEFGEHSKEERIRGGGGGGGGGGRHSSRTNLSMAARLKERGKFVTRFSQEDTSSQIVFILNFWM
jgi:hypothetical protein